MKILFLAPHPFYQERGTPIAVDLLVRTLAERGDEVDVATYHEGVDRVYPPTVQLHRIKAPPGCRNVRPGFSIKKLICDVYLYALIRRLLKKKTYDVIHAVEESVFMAQRIHRRTGIPYVFDMDSSMPTQIVDRMPFMRPLYPLMRRFEASAARNALAVTAVCDALGDLATEAKAKKVVLLRDVPLLDATEGASEGTGFKDSLDVDGLSLLYIGNLEPYQGIDLLLESFARCPSRETAQLVIVGGIEKHIQTYRAQAQTLGIADRTFLLGPRPLSDMAALMADADILVSPRTQGANTPMKIYSYMASGKPVLATDLPTHTQVLDAETACLAAPQPEPFARAMEDLLRDGDLRTRLGQAALQAVEEKYSPAVFRRTVNELYDWIADRVATTHDE